MRYEFEGDGHERGRGLQFEVEVDDEFLKRSRSSVERPLLGHPDEGGSCTAHTEPNRTSKEERQFGTKRNGKR